MIVLDDAYFDGHDKRGTLFADAKHRFVRFDFLEECLPYLGKVKIWTRWPDPDEYDNIESRMNAMRQMYLKEAQEAFDRAVSISRGFVVLRSKPPSIGRCVPPKNTTTIDSAGTPKLTDVHQKFLLKIARAKIVDEMGGPHVGDKNDKKTASEVRKRLRAAFQLREDEQNPVSSSHPKTGDKLTYYDVKMEVFVCSQNYMTPPQKPRCSRRRNGNADATN